MIRLCSQNRHTNTMSRGQWQRPTASLGTMRSVAEQSAQTVMRADGLQQAVGERRRLPRSSKARTSFAEVPGRSGINNTHGQLNDAMTHDSLVCSVKSHTTLHQGQFFSDVLLCSVQSHTTLHQGQFFSDVLLCNV